MKLSDIKNVDVYKDVDFDWLGLTAEEYENKRVLTFLNDMKYYEEIKKNTTVVGIITTPEIAKTLLNDEYGLIVSNNPKKLFFQLHNSLAKKEFYYSKKSNNISSKAIISSQANIGEFNIVIEDNVIIEPNVTIYPNVIIKKGSIIKSGTILGTDGFQYSNFGDEIIKVESIGSLIIDENVIIQNNCVIDKGVFDKTIIGENTKLYNLIHIAHDCKIGNRCLITAGVVVCGRVKIGNNSYLGPNCTVKNGLRLGKNSRVSMGSVVTKNVEDNETVTGNFAISHTKFLKIFKYLIKLIGE